MDALTACNIAVPIKLFCEEGLVSYEEQRARKVVIVSSCSVYNSRILRQPQDKFEGWSFAR